MLCGREREIGEIQTFIHDAVAAKSSGSLYISGPPGTGKTASVTYCADQLSKTKSSSALSIDYVYINCMEVNSPRALATVLETKLLSLIPTEKAGTKKATKRTGNERTSATRRQRNGLSIDYLISSCPRPVLLVLDEMDQLLLHQPDALYTAFGWTAVRRSRLILIGIANSLDLTQRFLPKLKLARPPKLIQFAPYSKEQLETILIRRNDRNDDSRENDENDGDQQKQDKMASQLCARKIAAGCGDVRRAIDICDSVGRSQRRRMSGNKKRKLSTTEQQANEGESATPKKVAALSAVKGVLSALNHNYSSPLRRARLTTHQKVLLATALALHRSGTKSFTNRQLEEAYTKSARTINIDPADEPSELIGLLESLGLIGFTLNGCRKSAASSSLFGSPNPARKRAKMMKGGVREQKLISLIVDEEDVRAVIQDDDILKKLIPN